MKTAKLVIGIISMVLFAFVVFQSCAAGLGNTMSENGELSGTAGLVVALCLLISGIVGVATRNKGKGGAFVAGGFYIVGGLIGFINAGSYSDLYIWSGVSIIFAAVFIIGTIVSEKKS